MSVEQIAVDNDLHRVRVRIAHLHGVMRVPVYQSADEMNHAWLRSHERDAETVDAPKWKSSILVSVSDNLKLNKIY